MARTKKSTLPTRILATLLSLAAAACGGGSPAMASGGDDCEGVISGDGEFALVVSGPNPAEECGIAVSVESSAGGNWGVQMLSTSNITQFNVWTDVGGRPGPGSYPIVDLAATDGSPASGNFVVMAIFDERSVGETLTSVSGTLTILSSSADEVSGTFEVSAREGTVAGGAATYTVSGSFTAANEDA